MRNCLFTVIMYLMIHGTAFGQDDVTEMLEAERVKDVMFFRVKNGLVTYAIDRDEIGRFKMLTNPLTIVAHGNSAFNLYFDYLNPLKYSVSFSEEVSDDPSYERLNQFASSVNSLLAMTSESTLNVTELDAENVKSFTIDPNRFPMDQKAILGIYAPSLLEWALWYHYELGDSCITNNKDQLSNAIAEADEHLFSIKGNRRPADDFRNQAKTMVRALVSANTMQALQDSLKYNTDILKSYNDQLSEALVKVKEANKNVVWDTTSALCIAYERYTDHAITRFLNEANTMLEQRKSLVASIKALQAHAKKYLSQRADTSNYWCLGEIRVEPGKIRDVTITVKRREVTFKSDSLGVQITDKDPVTAKFKVREYLGMVPQIATGVLYTNLSYPKFGTEEVGGKTMVARAQSDEVQNVVLSGMMNLIFNVGRGVVYPMLQLGVGTGDERPSLLAGTGLHFVRPTRWSLAFGAIWKWNRELDKLNVGDEITGTADLENDLELKFDTKPKLYLGIQTTF